TELEAGLDGPDRTQRQNTFELGEFLVRELGVTSLGARFEHRVAVLQSCHGLRDLGLGSPSELPAAAEPAPIDALLDGVAGLIRVPSERDECCGFGGMFTVGFPEVSARMGRARLREWADAGAEYVTGTDASCLLHLDGLRRREGYGPQPIHIAELLASEGEA
ncbi:MAG: (Fe-S)-binding protein, partial [bacterium]|nr:(Fe-S)-binding protein [bacterium]